MTEVNEKKSAVRSIIFDTTFIIGLATVFFYISAYRFEAGRKAFYHIPNKLTELNLQTIIRPSVPITTTLLIVAIAIIVYFILLFLIVFILDEYIIKRLFAKRFVVIKDLPFALKFIVSMVFMAVLFASYSQAYNFGKTSASNEKEFWTVEKEGKVYAVIDIYNNNFIAVPIDTRRSTYKSEYKFINPVDEKTQFIRMVLQEPLHEE